MMSHEPFDANPDPTLGRLLREHLAANDDMAFIARIRTALRAEPDSSWDVLARWTRPGLAAAAAIAIGLGLWLSLQAGETATLADAMQPADAPAQLLSSTPSSGPDVILAGLTEGR